MDYRRFSEDVAQLIGNVRPEAVREIIEMSNSRRYIFHGIKRNSSFVRRREEGVCARTPENKASFWSSGTYLFGKMEEGRLVTNDSTFFNYSNARDSCDGHVDTNLAIANYTDLEAAGIVLPDFQSDECLMLHADVPKTLIQFLRIELYAPDETCHRARGQMAERHLLAHIHDIVRSGYRPGELTTVEYGARKS